MRGEILEIRDDRRDLVGCHIQIHVEPDGIVVEDRESQIADVRIGENRDLNRAVERIIRHHPFQIPDTDPRRRGPRDLLGHDVLAVGIVFAENR